MDKSEKYIEMCRKSKEIQKLWIPQQGDYYFGPGCMPGYGYRSKNTDPIENETVLIGCSINFPFNHKTKEFVYDKFNLSYGDWSSGEIPKKICVWLPSVDCLIALYARYGTLRAFLNHLNMDYTFSALGGIEWQTMEQVGLSVVMRMCFHKKWNDKERTWKRMKPSKRLGKKLTQLLKKYTKQDDALSI